MADESKLVRDVPEDFVFFGGTVRLRLRVPSWRQAPEFIRRITEIEAKSWPALYEDSDSLAWVEGVWGSHVRLAMPVECDGRTIADAKDLLEEVNPAFVFTVLVRIGRLAFLSATEGKASGSPSTPPAGDESATGGSSSPAESIGPADGPAS